MAFNVLAYAAANKYTAKTVEGGGAVKGKNCTIESIETVGENQKVTFKWILDDGTVETGYMLVPPGPQGDPGDPGEAGKGIKDSYVDENEHFIIVYDDDTEKDCGKITVVSGGGELERDLTTSVTVGGIAAGTSYEDGTSLESILRDMLNPTAYPTLTNPSATLTATGSKLLETGATLSTTFTITFNRGSISPAYGTSGYRSGPATAYTFDGETGDTNTFARTITSAKTSYQGSVSYSEGEQPKDSVGGDYSTPLAAGSVNTGTITYEFVDALWANTAAIGTIAKLSLISKSTKQKDFAFPAQTVANPEVFDVPASWTVTAVQVKNDLSGAYEDAISQFTVTDVTHEDAAGNSVAYKRYTFNLGYDTGARNVRLKWS